MAEKHPNQMGAKGEYKVGHGKPPIEHQFKPGDPGGPGRPKRKTLAERAKDVLGFVPEGAEISAEEGILMMLRSAALKGNLKAVEMLFDRAWGKPNVSISHGGDEDKPPIRVIRSYNGQKPKPETDNEN